MAPPHKLVMAPGAVFRGNTVYEASNLMANVNVPASGEIII